jgi:hypothetical protein
MVILDQVLANLNEHTSEAVAHFWRTRDAQSGAQARKGTTDQGSRAAVTGGAQMESFIRMIADHLIAVGIPSDSIYRRTDVQLPGFFRPTKEWDLIVVREGRLVAALEAKSQVGSFGNNFNNRTEEAMGSALDLWTAYREGAFGITQNPWVGYLFLLQDCEKALTPVRARSPHYPVFPEFADASYARRYELFCRKLVLERHYSSSALLMSAADSGTDGVYREPAPDLSIRSFMRSLLAHALGHS